MIVKDLTNDPTICIVGCLHGDELLGKEIIERLSSEMPHLPIRTIIANEEAMAKKVRCIDTDLNRSFPGSVNHGNEERLAVKILEQTKKCKYVIDIHSTTSNMDDCIITTTRSFRKNRTRDLIKRVPVKNVIIMNKLIGKNSSLIDHVACGISIEFNYSKSVPFVLGVVKSTIRNIIEDRVEGNKNYFKIVRSMKSNGITRIKVENFAEVKKGREFAVSDGKKIIARYDLCPVFINEKAYTGIACLISKKLSVDQ